MRAPRLCLLILSILLSSQAKAAETYIADVSAMDALEARRIMLTSAHSEAGADAGKLPLECEKTADCCPSWSRYLDFDFLLMGRTNGLRNQPLVLDVGNNNQVLMNTRDFDMGVAPGVRLLTGRRSDVGPGWELGYTGIFNAFADKSFSNGVFSAPGDLAQQLDGWTTADNIRPTHQSTLNLAEANLVWSTCCEGCDPDATLKWKRCEHCVCSDLIFGFVWAGLYEQANYNVICCPGDPVSTYGVEASNNLYGFQVGVRRRAEWERWSLQASLKGAFTLSDIHVNSTSVYSTLAQNGNPNDPLVTVRDPIQVTDGDFAGLIQFNVTAAYRLNSRWALRAGYNLIGLIDVALAGDQWDFTDTADSGRGLDGTGNPLFHGGNFGIEYHW